MFVAVIDEISIDADSGSLYVVARGWLNRRDHELGRPADFINDFDIDLRRLPPDRVVSRDDGSVRTVLGAWITPAMRRIAFLAGKEPPLLAREASPAVNVLDAIRDVIEDYAERWERAPISQRWSSPVRSGRVRRTLDDPRGLMTPEARAAIGTPMERRPDRPDGGRPGGGRPLGGIGLDVAMANMTAGKPEDAGPRDRPGGRSA